MLGFYWDIKKVRKTETKLVLSPSTPPMIAMNPFPTPNRQISTPYEPGLTSVPVALMAAP